MRNAGRAGDMITRFPQRHIRYSHAIRWSSQAGGLLPLPGNTLRAIPRHAEVTLDRLGRQPFQPARHLKLPQLSDQMSGQGSRLPICSVQRSGGWADMGQWIVSVPGLEPLHLRVTPAPRKRW